MLWQADKVVPKEFITEPPTLISLGFEWQIDGDGEVIFDGDGAYNLFLTMDHGHELLFPKEKTRGEQLTMYS